MKNKLHITKRLLTLSCMLFFALVMAGNASYAQSEQKSNKNDGSDPVQTYMLKRPNSTIVQLFKANPNDADLARALKLAVILENPGGYPEFSQADISRMQQESTAMNDQFKQVNDLVNQGNSFERAKAHIQRTSQNAKIQQEQAPSLMVAPGQ
ncbi:MAG: hypothetical protein ACK5DJ_04960 [Bacteroidota bacterium]|jgi:hypothetical protein